MYTIFYFQSIWKWFKLGFLWFKYAKFAYGEVLIVLKLKLKYVKASGQSKLRVWFVAN